MDRAQVAQSRKAEVARRQLGTALHLFLADLDPVSVHVLACGGCEVASALAAKIGTPFSDFTQETFPEYSARDLATMRNQFWNAMKHANHRDGQERDDEDLLATPLEKENEARLFAGWFDLGQVGIPLPIEAQVFTLWALAKHGDHSELDDWADEEFPNLSNLGAEEQRTMLSEKIEWAKGHPDLAADPRTDLRPLILPAEPS